MEDTLISFETAKLAKEKKFNIPCENFYIEYIDDDVADLFNYEEQRGSGYAELYRNNQEFKYSASTQSLLQKWLREVHHICVCPKNEVGNVYVTDVVNTSNNDLYHIYKNGVHIIGKQYLKKYERFDTYEEALEIGLFEALKLIK